MRSARPKMARSSSPATSWKSRCEQNGISLLLRRLLTLGAAGGSSLKLSNFSLAAVFNFVRPRLPLRLRHFDDSADRPKPTCCYVRLRPRRFPALHLYRHAVREGRVAGGRAAADGQGA